MLWIHFIIFLTSCILLYFSAEWVINSLIRVARFLGWKEFVVAFFIMAFSSSLPNLFLGVFSAFQKIPQLSLGDIIGGNVIDLTLAIGLATLFIKNGGIVSDSRLVQTSSFFVLISAILPLILSLDKEISRLDGFLLIAFFFVYIFWLFAKKERFSKAYEDIEKTPLFQQFKEFLIDLLKIIGGIFLLLLATEGIIKSSQFFAEFFHLSLIFIGLLIVALGNALPETYLSIISAKKGEGWMILGNLMGSVILPATLVLGVVALICPIKNLEISTIVVARIFLFLSAVFFFFFVRSDRKISKTEGIFLVIIYFLFFIAEILIK